MSEDIRDILHIMESGIFDIESIITHEFPLSAHSEAIQTAADPRHSFDAVAELTSVFFLRTKNSRISH